MKTRVTKAFRHRGQLLTEGTVLTVEAQYFPRLAHLVEPLTLEDAEEAYFNLLAIWWNPTTEDLTPKEIHRLLDCLDGLYQALHRQGRKVPVRLPVEKRRGEHRKELAL